MSDQQSNPLTQEELVAIGKRIGEQKAMATYPGGVGRPQLIFSRGITVSPSPNVGGEVRLSMHICGDMHDICLTDEQARHIANLLLRAAHESQRKG